jgi:hypothetical protein
MIDQNTPSTVVMIDKNTPGTIVIIDKNTPAKVVMIDKNTRLNTVFPLAFSVVALKIINTIEDQTSL